VSRDEIVVCLLIGSLVAWGVVHVLVVSALLSSPARWKGLVALIVVPLAPYWAARAKLWVRVALWCATLVTWLAVRLFFAK
jgi:hypothetical protein